MKIRHPLAFGISMIAAAVFLYFVWDRVTFLRSAERTTGKVTAVTYSNESCGSRRNRHACTKFHADVEFRADDDRYSTSVSAGSSRGHDAPLTAARYRVGSAVEVVYNPRSPSQAYRDTLWDVWSAPIVSLMVQLGALFSSFTEPRRRR